MISKDPNQERPDRTVQIMVKKSVVTMGYLDREDTLRILERLAGYRLILVATLAGPDYVAPHTYSW